MIVLRNLTKTFSMNGRRKTVADNLNTVFPTGVSVGLLGRNGAGKSTLLKLIAGTSSPTWGEVLSNGSVSFPVGLASSLHADLTGAQNTRFVARIYGADTEELMEWVEDFAELGEHFHLPVRSYSSGMRGRLSFGINMGLAFDTYLIDEVTAVGDASFKKKSSEVFNARMENAGAIFVSHSPGTLREMCTAGAVLENGQLAYYDDIEEAIERYTLMIDPSRAHPVVTPSSGRAKTKFPDDAIMLFGLGLYATHAEWIGDCLRRHRPCHFPPAREPHYFDVRAGRSAVIVQRRSRALEDLSGRFSEQPAEQRLRTLKIMSEMSDLLRIHAAPASGPDRHNAYVDFLTTNRTVHPVICDFTPDYARLGKDQLVEMSDLGDAAFVVVLRDPVIRLWEHLCTDQPKAQRSPEACRAEIEALEKVGPEKTLARRPDANYARLFEALDASVPQAKLLVLFHEEIDAPESRRAALDRLTGFLELPEVPDARLPAFPEPPEILPLPADLALRMRRLLAAQYEAMEARFGAALPPEWTAPAEAVDAASAGAVS